MIKYIYKHKKTKSVVVTSEKLDRRQWEYIGERRDTKIYSNDLKQKDGR